MNRETKLWGCQLSNKWIRRTASTHRQILCWEWWLFFAGFSPHFPMLFLWTFFPAENDGTLYYSNVAVTHERIINRILVFAGICVESAGCAGDTRRVPRQRRRCRYRSGNSETNAAFTHQVRFIMYNPSCTVSLFGVCFHYSHAILWHIPLVSTILYQK